MSGVKGVIFEDERCVMTRERNVAFVGWRNAPLAKHIREWRQLGRAIAKEHRGAGACFDVVVRGTPSFPDEVRRESQALAADAAIFELGYAHIITIPGLGGTAVRAFISTILLVSRPPAPAKVFREVAGAAAWFAPQLTAYGWDAAALRTSCNDLVARLETPAT